MIAAYPLTWPHAIPRSSRREKGAFKTSLAGALNNVKDSLRRFGQDSGKPITNVVLSSNYSLGVDKPTDPGVAAWFTWDGAQFCIPVDRYESPAANLQAIHHIIESRRVELRHGTLALVRATFSGFKTLPAPAEKRAWRDVMELGVLPVSMAELRNRYLRLASIRHPDKGGTDAAMAELNRAYEEAQKELQQS